MATVSVVIPSYNSEVLLRRAIASVLAQTMRDLEIIVVDDGSARPPVTITQLDPRVRLVCQHNQGVSVARNVGVRSAESELIAFLDQDDEWLPHKLERQIAHVTANPNASFWCTGFDWVTPDSTTPSYSVQLTYRGLLRSQSVILSTTLMRRSDYWAQGGHDPMLLQMQDWDLFLRLAVAGEPPAMLDDRLVRYHLHGSNTSQDYRLATRERLAILEAHERRAKVHGDRETVRAIESGRNRTRELFSQKAIDATRTSLRGAHTLTALGHLWYAAGLSPRTAVNAVAISISTQLRRALSRVRAAVSGRN